MRKIGDRIFGDAASKREAERVKEIPRVKRENGGGETRLRPAGIGGRDRRAERTGALVAQNAADRTDAPGGDRNAEKRRRDVVSASDPGFPVSVGGTLSLRNEPPAFAPRIFFF
jgi:hypothetical protein